jgi:hypothetical protein
MSRRVQWRLPGTKDTTEISGDRDFEKLKISSLLAKVLWSSDTIFSEQLRAGEPSYSRDINGK